MSSWNAHVCTREHTMCAVNTHTKKCTRSRHTRTCSSDNKHVFSWNTTVCLIGTQTCVHVDTHMCTQEHTHIYAHPEHTHTSVHLKTNMYSPETQTRVHWNTHVCTREHTYVYTWETQMRTREHTHAHACNTHMCTAHVNTHTFMRARNTQTHTSVHLITNTCSPGTQPCV